MNIEIPDSFRLVDTESFNEYIHGDASYKRVGMSDGIKYSRLNGEYFAAKLDNGECYSKYEFWRCS